MRKSANWLTPKFYFTLPPNYHLLWILINYKINNSGNIVPIAQITVQWSFNLFGDSTQARAVHIRATWRQQKARPGKRCMHSKRRQSNCNCRNSAISRCFIANLSTVSDLDIQITCDRILVVSMAITGKREFRDNEFNLVIPTWPLFVSHHKKHNKAPRVPCTIIWTFNIPAIRVCLKYHNICEMISTLHSTTSLYSWCTSGWSHEAHLSSRPLVSFLTRVYNFLHHSWKQSSDSIKNPCLIFIVGLCYCTQPKE